MGDFRAEHSHLYSDAVYILLLDGQLRKKLNKGYLLEPERWIYYCFIIVEL